MENERKGLMEERPGKKSSGLGEDEKREVVGSRSQGFCRIDLDLQWAARSNIYALKL